MWQHCVLFLVFHFVIVISKIDNFVSEDVIQTRHFIFWPNATIPFYINPEHFDHEQSLQIMTTLTSFAFKTCLKFAPLLAPPAGDHHVMVFENPQGVKHCDVVPEVHPFGSPHIIVLPYECLISPHIERFIMRALGFPYEHNRAIRDIYIDIQYENIQPGAIDLFTKEPSLPAELRALPYDLDSVTHFDDREYSKNGHRTFIIKKLNMEQNRVSLTPTDIRKIEIVYGPECRMRDRQEKIEMCQNYPGIRRKREISLRVNPDITPPPEVAEPTEGVAAQQMNKELAKNLKELGIVDEVQNLLDRVHYISSLALSNSRLKYCNITENKEILRSNNTKTDALGVIEAIASFAKSIVEDASKNLTAFCENAANVETYERSVCSEYGCHHEFHSTKYGPGRWSTQHRPILHQPTRHTRPDDHKWQSEFFRSGNATDNTRRRKRSKRGDAEESGEGKDGREKKSAGEVQSSNSDDNTDDNRDAESGENKMAFTKIYFEDDDDALRLGTTRDDSADENRRAASRQSYKQHISQDENRLSSSSKKRRAKRKKGNVKRKPRKVKKRNREQLEAFDEVTPSAADDGQNRKGYSKQDDQVKKSSQKRNKRKRPRTTKPHRTTSKRRTKSKRTRTTPQMANASQIDDSLPKTVPLSKINQEFYSERKWPDGIVRYMIQDVDDSRYDLNDILGRLEEVNAILKKRTCVRLEEISQSATDLYKDYIVLDTSPDFVTGKVGGRQNFGVVELFVGGQHRQHAAMMVMAMLGFYFEISRHDRDKYIVVHNRHVRPDKLHHFERIREDATLALPYDYRSATHPSWQFWRKLGRKGIATVATFKENDPDGSLMKSLGQNPELLSDIDVIKINSVYGVECFEKLQAAEGN